MDSGLAMEPVIGPATSGRTRWSRPGMTGQNQCSASPLRRGRAPLVLLLLPSTEVRGAERRQALVRNAAPGGPSRERTDLGFARDHRPMTRTGAPFGALLRRSSYGVGPRFRRWRKACPPIVSQLLAGDHSVPGRSPDAARVPVASRQRGRRPSTRPGIAGRRLPDLRTCSPVPPPACSTIKTPLDGAPRRAGCTHCPSGFSSGDNFFSGKLSPGACLLRPTAPCPCRRAPSSPWRILRRRTPCRAAHAAPC